ncbi:hypothetical protein SRB17_53030 [Streptomyces sp. RB17]|nr:hypothetical protein [Streptomyces sp. RB17]
MALRVAGPVDLLLPRGPGHQRNPIDAEVRRARSGLPGNGLVTLVLGLCGRSSPPAIPAGATRFSSHGHVVKRDSVPPDRAGCRHAGARAAATSPSQSRTALGTRQQSHADHDGHAQDDLDQARKLSRTGSATAVDGSPQSRHVMDLRAARRWCCVRLPALRERRRTPGHWAAACRPGRGGGSEGAHASDPRARRCGTVARVLHSDFIAFRHICLSIHLPFDTFEGPGATVVPERTGLGEHPAGQHRDAEQGADAGRRERAQDADDDQPGGSMVQKEPKPTGERCRCPAYAFAVIR